MSLGRVSTYHRQLSWHEVDFNSREDGMANFCVYCTESYVSRYLTIAAPPR